MAEEEVQNRVTQRPRLCRYYLSWNGCREGDSCSFKHDDEIPPCRYYNSKYGCWNGRWCRFRHVEGSPEEKSNAQHFYQELNQWLGPSKLDESTCSTANESLLIEAAKGPNPEKKYMSRATQTKSTPEFIHCGECGEEFKSGRTIQQSLERHYIHMLASADFYHIRFFRRHTELRRSDALCAACGDVFKTVEALLQHMGAKVSGMAQDTSLRVEHQNWFKQLVQPFVYRDLEVLDTDEDLIQRLLETYFVQYHDDSARFHDDSVTLVAEPEAELESTTKDEYPTKASPTKASPTKASPTKVSSTKGSPIKSKPDANNNEQLDTVEDDSTITYCGSCEMVFSTPHSETKLRVHYEDCLGRADGLHVEVFKNAALDGQAMCRVCRKLFQSPISLMQHIGSKKKLDDTEGTTIQHAELLFELAEVFLERDLKVEGCSTEEQVVERLIAIVTPAGRRKSTPDASKLASTENTCREANVDDSMEMARYFCQINKWQARMPYPEYIRDDHERTRNSGFTVGEVEYLKSLNIRADSPAAFKALNNYYKKRNFRGPIRSARNWRRQSKDVVDDAGTSCNPAGSTADKEAAGDAAKKVLPTKRKASTAIPRQASVAPPSPVPVKASDKSPLKAQVSIAENKKREDEVRDESPKPRRKKQRRRSIKTQKSVDQAAAQGSDEVNAAAGPKRKRRGSGQHARRLALLKRKREAREKEQENNRVKMLFLVDKDGRVYMQAAPTKSKTDKDEKTTATKDDKSSKSIKASVFVVHENGVIDVPGKNEKEEAGVDKVDGNTLGKVESGQLVVQKELVELVAVRPIAQTQDSIPPTQPDEPSVLEGVLEDEGKDTVVIINECSTEDTSGGDVESKEAVVATEMKETSILTPSVKEERVVDASDVKTEADECDGTSPNTSTGKKEALETEAEIDISAKTSDKAPENKSSEGGVIVSPRTKSAVLEKVRQFEQAMSSKSDNTGPSPTRRSGSKGKLMDDVNNNVDTNKNLMSQELEPCTFMQSTEGEDSGRTAV